MRLGKILKGKNLAGHVLKHCKEKYKALFHNHKENTVYCSSGLLHYTSLFMDFH